MKKINRNRFLILLVLLVVIFIFTWKTQATGFKIMEGYANMSAGPGGIDWKCHCPRLFGDCKCWVPEKK